MRKYTSYSSLGNRHPVKQELYILPNNGNVLPTKDITLNYYKEIDELLRPTEVARIGSFVANYIFFHSFKIRLSLLSVYIVLNLYYLSVNYL